MVVLAASICTRGGKAVLSRQFREIPRSRIEALLAAFPKLADSGTQHTTVEQDNVRFVYQPLDELYIVLITNRQSNILQDIDSLHLFAQVTTSICKSLEEQDIVRNAFELLSAFDELVTLGYRENLSLSQIKTFLEMESHEERIQEIIERNKELEASEERKRKAKQLEMQRKEAGRTGRGVPPRAPNYPIYTPPSRPSVPETYDSYEAEKKKTFAKPLPTRGKGMQLGKKSKATDIYEKVRGDLGPEIEEASPLVTPQASTPVQEPTSARESLTADREPIHITIAETISATLTREGALKSFEVKGDLQLRITDPAFTKLRLDLQAIPTQGAQFRTHPNVDKALFTSTSAIQLKDTTKRFPANNSIGVLRWRVASTVDNAEILPITFTVWVNKGFDTTTVTVEYELTSSDSLRDVVVTIPYGASEPAVSSFDAVYEVSGDSLDWNLGTVDESNPSGSFEFESTGDSDENEFFPMSVRFTKSKPFVEVDVLDVSLLEMEGESAGYAKDIRSVAENYLIE
ncbi:Coatomer subunit delta [Penicillium canariense]|uniref:Coatomer subunit delta n=1 Tax=Penicillium canariense TaxID=189055 RepID=A0A9W9I5B3_9EURO|nr:Coatomer subunit delta [Penicillium canariense]KAJ5167311.1 Coatomer subunit delta [Penicillium canariense]